MSNSNLARARIAFPVLAFSLLLPAGEGRAQGGSAVITLVMPVGARQLGMGETAIALADDVYGTFWNPAGMAFGPLSNEWELVLPAGYTKSGVEMRREFTSLATKPRSGFLLKSTVWAGTRDGLLLYNGKFWKDYHEYVLEQGDKIDKVVRRYAGTGDNLDSLVKIVKAFNQISTTKDEEDLISLKLPYDLLFKGEAVNALALDNTDRVWVGTTGGLYRFDGSSWKAFNKEEGFTYTPATGAAPAPATVADTTRPDSASAAPGAAAVTPGDSATGTVAPAPTAESYRKLAVTALAVKGSSVWIGTEDGLYEYRKTTISRRGQNLLPDQHISGIAAHEELDEVYVSMPSSGIARYTPPKSAGSAAKWKLFGVADGLLDSTVNRVLLDKYGHVWAAHPGGVSHYSLRAWEKIHFRKQEVRSLALDENGNIWIGTSEGAWKHTPYYSNAKGRTAAKKKSGDPEEGSKAERRGDWVHFHTGNGLSDKNIMEVRAQGPDIWFVTAAGVERYNSAKSQVGFFYESLLPVLNLPDLYHAFMAATFPVEEWGTVGGFINYVSFGQNQQTNAAGDEIAKFDSYELVGALSYGTRLNNTVGLGLNAKFIYSALARGLTQSGQKSDGIAASYAVDLGLLWKQAFLKNLSLAFVMQNMGPAVFYVDQAQADPIPFTWKLGAAYEVLRTPNHRLTVAADANREAVYREGNSASPVYIGAWKDLVYPFDTKDSGAVAVFRENVRQTVFNTGMEYVYANVAAFRTGYLYDESGKRYELDVGLGFMLSDILQVDGTFIKSFDNGIRNGQKRFSMLMRF